MCRLKWALYGLKQTHHAWYTKIDSYLTNFNFTKSEADENLYHILAEGKFLIIVLYVDDLILTSDEHLIKYFKEVVEKLVWVDAMVEKYESTVKNNVFEVFPRLEDKSVVSSIWIFTVKHVTKKA